MSVEGPKAGMGEGPAPYPHRGWLLTLFDNSAETMRRKERRGERFANRAFTASAERPDMGLSLRYALADARMSGSCADRKPVECRQRLQAWLQVPEIDLTLEKRDFIIQLAFVEVDEP